MIKTIVYAFISIKAIIFYLELKNDWRNFPPITIKYTSNSKIKIYDQYMIYFA